MRKFWGILLACSALQMQAQQVIRGPYLQRPTTSSITIRWRTDVPTSTQVQYGPSPTAMTNTLMVNNNVTDHSVQLNNLAPYTTYYYSVGNVSSVVVGPSNDYRFHTNPVEGTEQPIRVWAIGDFGKGSAGQVDVKNSYMNYPGSQNTDVWLWLGDNAYNDGKDDEYQTKVFTVNGFSDIFSWLPFLPTPGNHDYGEVWSQSAPLSIPYSNIPLQNHQGPYYDIVDVPQLGEAGGEPSQLEVFYSFDYGNVHFLSLNSEVFDLTMTYDGINAMKNWIIQDLQQNDRLFTIAYFHQPPYSKGSHDSDSPTEQVMKAMRERIIPTLEDFDIDLVVCGHSHVYERSFLIHGHYGNSGSFNAGTMLMNGTNGNFNQGNAYVKDTLDTTANGTVYVVCGNSGSDESNPPLDHPIMFYSEGGSAVMGSLVMDIYKNRLDAKYLTRSGQIMDDFTIVKQNMALHPQPDLIICAGDSVQVGVTYTGGSDSISYSWFPQVSGTSSATLQPPVTTWYAVTVTDHISGQQETDTFIVNVVQPPAPVIAFSGDTLFTQPGYIYQWFLNGVAIPGATLNYYVPVANGDYTVLCTAGSCSALSPDYPFSQLQVNEPQQQNVKIFPNPSSGFITVQVDQLNFWQMYAVTDLAGHTLCSGTLNGTETKIMLPGYRPGTYLLRLEGQQCNRVLTFLLK